jgi:hypothetical protein
MAMLRIEVMAGCPKDHATAVVDGQRYGARSSAGAFCQGTRGAHLMRRAPRSNEGRPIALVTQAAYGSRPPPTPVAQRTPAPTGGPGLAPMGYQGCPTVV